MKMYPGVTLPASFMVTFKMGAIKSGRYIFQGLVRVMLTRNHKITTDRHKNVFWISDIVDIGCNSHIWALRREKPN